MTSNAPSAERALIYEELLSYPPDHLDQCLAAHHLTVEGDPEPERVWRELVTAFQAHRNADKEDLC